MKLFDKTISYFKNGFLRRRGLQRNAVLKASHLSSAEYDRYLKSRCIYLETSAFNYLVDNFEIPDLELTRAYQKRKGVIFLTSPVLLWEIMLNSDSERADRMLLAAQALFDPILLASPTELTVRYLKHAYPQNTINYSYFADFTWANFWRPMTEDFGRTLSYKHEDILQKTEPFRAISKNLNYIIGGREHGTELIDLTTFYISSVYSAIQDDLETWKVDEVTAKFVILYVFLLLIVFADLDGEEAKTFWEEKGFTGNLEQEQITKVFVDYPEIFVCGPILEMATMSAFQYNSGGTNRGALHDGMHMVYAPYVHAILSNDAAFLELPKQKKFYRGKVVHLSDLEFFTRELQLSDYPDDQKSRNV